MRGEGEGEGWGKFNIFLKQSKKGEKGKGRGREGKEGKEGKGIPSSPWCENEESKWARRGREGVKARI